MSIIQSRVVVVAKPGQWEEARRIARLQVDDANTRSGTLAYEIYEDAGQSHLINLAAYRDADAWQEHTRSNPHAKTYMQHCEVVSIEVHGNPTPELRAVIESYGSARIYPSIP